MAACDKLPLSVYLEQAHGLFRKYMTEGGALCRDSQKFRLLPLPSPRIYKPQSFTRGRPTWLRVATDIRDTRDNSSIITTAVVFFVNPHDGMCNRSMYTTPWRCLYASVYLEQAHPL